MKDETLLHNSDLFKSEILEFKDYSLAREMLSSKELKTFGIENEKCPANYNSFFIARDLASPNRKIIIEKNVSGFFAKRNVQYWVENIIYNDINNLKELANRSISKFVEETGTSAFCSILGIKRIQAEKISHLITYKGERSSKVLAYGKGLQEIDNCLDIANSNTLLHLINQNLELSQLEKRRIVLPLFDMLANHRIFELPIILLENLITLPIKDFPKTKHFKVLNLYCEEAARLLPGIKIYRFAPKDLTFSKFLVKKETIINIDISSANQDFKFFRDANKFNPFRPNLKYHLAFGIGRHHCFARSFSIQFASTIAQTFLEIHHEK